MEKDMSFEEMIEAAEEDEDDDDEEGSEEENIESNQSVNEGKIFPNKISLAKELFKKGSSEKCLETIYENQGSLQHPAAPKKEQPIVKNEGKIIKNSEDAISSLEEKFKLGDEVLSPEEKEKSNTTITAMDNATIGLYLRKKEKENNHYRDKQNNVSEVE